MKRIWNRPLMVAVLTAVLLEGFSSTVDAGFVLRVSGGSTTKTITDNGVGDMNSDVGAIVYSGSLDGWTIIFAAGTSKPIIGNPFLAEIDNATFAVSSSTAGTLTIDLTDTDFSVVPGSNNTALLTSAFTGSISGPLSASGTSFVQYGAGGNSEFGGIDNNSGTVVSVGPHALNTTLSVIVSNISNPFSLSNQIVLVSGGSGGNISGDLRTSVATPAPGGFLLVGMGILGLVGFRMHRKSTIA